LCKFTIVYISFGTLTHGCTYYSIALGGIIFQFKNLQLKIKPYKISLKQSSSSSNVEYIQSLFFCQILNKFAWPRGVCMNISFHIENQWAKFLYSNKDSTYIVKLANSNFEKLKFTKRFNQFVKFLEILLSKGENTLWWLLLGHSSIHY
jgi:hypothetical protein